MQYVTPENVLQSVSHILFAYSVVIEQQHATSICRNLDDFCVLVHFMVAFPAHHRKDFGEYVSALQAAHLASLSR